MNVGKRKMIGKFDNGELTLHVVGPFTVFEYINPHRIPLIYIATDRLDVLKRFSLPRESSFVFQGKIYYIMRIKACVFGDESIGVSLNDVESALRYCSSILVNAI